MLSLYEISYALLFTSILEEPLSYTVLESMLAGTLPIISGVGGVFELVRGTLAESMIYKPNNSEQLLERIEYVLSLSREQI
jgi:glycosyltransferase involved in cell wall biosynthesis